MKKLLLAIFALTTFTVYANDYPAACAELEALTTEAIKLSPEMQAQFESVGQGDAETRKKDARDAWAKMSASEKEQAAKGCELAAPQMKQVIEALKAQK